MAKSTVLITGASSGIGEVYAERFARRGHDLVLVARDRARLDEVASRLRRDTGVTIDVLQADLTVADDLVRVEQRLASDGRIEIFVNNAGASLPGGFATQDRDQIDALIRLNVTATTRLVHAVTPRFLAAGAGSIINIASVVGVAPEIGMTVYGATKAFLLYLTQGLQLELGPRGIYLQAVLPAATRTAIWGRSGRDVDQLQGVMPVDALVDAALVGFDRKELVTIPPLPDADQWATYDGARKAMLPNFPQVEPAARYRTQA